MNMSYVDISNLKKKLANKIVTNLSKDKLHFMR